MNRYAPGQASFLFPSPDEYRRLRDVLRRLGYQERNIVDTLGVSEMGSVRGTDVPVLMRRTRGGSPLDTLVRLFLVEAPVDLGSLTKAIEPTQVATLRDAGLVEVHGQTVSSAVKLIPCCGLLIAFDLPRRLDSGGGDYVMGVGSSSLTLANITIRRHSALTLDLGTGCGIQALLASPHSDRVYAVDRNLRALRLAHFNTLLNGLENIACAEGDLFHSVTDRTFDLVVSNPPFVISPEMRYVYRDSGMEGDEICRKIVREVPQFLNDGGYCQILCHWVEKSGEDWAGALERWFDGTGCDAWVMRCERSDAERYAMTWITHTESGGDIDVARKFDEWMAYYEEMGIEAISAGVITMRRRKGVPNWFRAGEAPERMAGQSGDAVLTGFALRDYLETVRDDSALLRERIRLPRSVLLEKRLEPSGENPDGTRKQKGCKRSFGRFPRRGNTARLLILPGRGASSAISPGLRRCSAAFPSFASLTSSCNSLTQSIR